MCSAVLNDDWASHPTWASEDSGFVAHRKNIFEESLHRIEEERHDYDFNIEANLRVIQLLEPIAQSLLVMDPADRENFIMPVGLGGQSQAIYKRVLKKVYGPERGPEVAADLFKDPCSVLPILLARLKQKDEEWRFTQVCSPPDTCYVKLTKFQREWEKVWNAQTTAMYLKSLDHMGLHVKSQDKKNFSMKHLIDSIKTKHEEQRRQRITNGIKAKSSKHQFTFEFSDQGVIADVLRIMILYATNSSQHNNPERRRISEFFEKFVTTFFEIPEDLVADRTRDIDRGTPDDDLDDIAPTELPNGRGRRPINGKKNDLRRGVLDRSRNGNRGRGQKEDSTTGSKESTPDVDSVVEEEAVEDQTPTEVTNERWLAVPGAIAIQGTQPLDADDTELSADRPFRREWYSLYCNSHIYGFFSIFQTLYRRFKEIKQSEDDAVSEGNRARSAKPAKEIGLIDEKSDFYGAIDGDSYYSRTLALVEDFVSGDLEDSKFQDFLRHFYLKKGWQLYTITDLLKSLCRQGATCSSIDPKEKTPDLVEQFYHDRESKETTSYNTEINLRKQADKYIKDGELFLIRWARDFFPSS
jgi:paired amphipathic helix protein Sin3a